MSFLVHVTFFDGLLWPKNDLGPRISVFGGNSDSVDEREDDLCFIFVALCNGSHDARPSDCGFCQRKGQPFPWKDVVLRPHLEKLLHLLTPMIWLVPSSTVFQIYRPLKLCTKFQSEPILNPSSHGEWKTISACIPQFVTTHFCSFFSLLIFFFLSTFRFSPFSIPIRNFLLMHACSFLRHS